MFGHMAAHCPTKSSSTSQAGANIVGMAQNVISDSNSWVSVEPDACIQDGGASTFLAGSEYVLRYLKWLELIGMDVKHLHFKRCDKSFKFGGDGESVSLWMVQLPAKLGEKVGRIQCFVIFGATLMLLGRPTLDMLNAVVDFGGKRMSLLGGDWQEIRCGKGGAMLLKLADGVTHGSQLMDVQFDLISEDDDHDQVLYGQLSERPACRKSLCPNDRSGAELHATWCQQAQQER